MNLKSANSPVDVMAIISIAFGILQAQQLPKKVKSTECGKGGVVQATKKGKRLISRGDWCCHPLEIVVGPGQIHIETLAIDKLFEVSTIDTYSITIKRFVGKLDQSGVADLTSNSVALKVTN